ncbi:MAG TPA: glycosyltransferase family 9 protein [bacterium]|nr:glycosyltransferase family 9 protein [bacterium]
MELSIVIVNYNMKQLVSECIASLEKVRDEISFEVIVVDNDSSDGSAGDLAEKWQWVEIIESGENAGFARACNRGADASQGDHVLFLNPDTEVKPGTLRCMVEFFKNNPVAGIIGCRTVNTDGSLEPSVYRFPTLWRTFVDTFYLGGIFGGYEVPPETMSSTSAVEVICGACFMMRGEALKQVGAFDEEFWMYGEDVELCYRAKKAGWESWYINDCEIVHKRGQRHLGEDSYHDLARISYNHYKWIFCFYDRHFPGLAGILRLMMKVQILPKVWSRRRKLSRGDDSRNNTGRLEGLARVLEEFVYLKKDKSGRIMSAAKNLQEIKDIRKIGVYIGVPGLGDLLFIIPLFRALKKQYPDAEVVFIGKLLREYVRPVFDACPYIDGLMEFHFYEELKVGSLVRFVRELRKRKFDLIVDTQRKFVPSLLLRLGKKGHMVSYSSRGCFSDFVVDVPDKDNRHTTDISLDLARAIGIDNPALELEISITDESRQYAMEFYSQNGIAEDDTVVGLIPSAGHPSRCWSVDKFAELAEIMSGRGCKLMCFGSPMDQKIIDSLMEKVGVPVVIEDFSRKSILDSAALMARCDAIVGGDSGPLHVADSTSAPCIGIYGPTLPERFGLLGGKCVTICHYDDCSPCSNHECKHRKCIENISVEEVISAVDDVLCRK